MERGDLALDHWELLAGGLKHRMVQRPVELLGRGMECYKAKVLIAPQDKRAPLPTIVVMDTENCAGQAKSSAAIVSLKLPGDMHEMQIIYFQNVASHGKDLCLWCRVPGTLLQQRLVPNDVPATAPAASRWPSSGPHHRTPMYRMRKDMTECPEGFGTHEH